MPFDPLELARRTEKIVCKGIRKKYDAFPYLVDSENNKCISAWGSGCCLRCVFCWAPRSRDSPKTYGTFHTPKEVVENLYSVAHKGNLNPKTVLVGLSGCEPTIGKEHLLRLMELLDESDFNQISIDTNGILLGYDVHYLYNLAMASAKLTYRVSLKAGTPEGFEKRTGAKGLFYELPFQAIRNIGKLYAGKHCAIPLSLWAMTDPRIMPRKERKILIAKLRKINPSLPGHLREETVCPYKRTLVRLKKAGVKIKFTKDEYKFAKAVPF